ncbi:MAG: hypothetical protein GX604_05730 [Actinobacteria bacterium]|nr:hypothetical protein [Actinomycetota bacterium]
MGNWFAKFAHISCAVMNQQETVERLRKIGIKPFEFYSFPPLVGKWSVRGVPVEPGDVAGPVPPIGAWIGGPELEIQQASRGSVYWDFMEARGDGYHHVAFAVNDLDRVVAALEERGLNVLFAGKWEGGGWAYVESDELGGMIFEFFENADLLGESTEISSTFRSFRHVGAVVPDLARTTRFLAGMGSGPFLPSFSSDQGTATFRGRPMDGSHKRVSAVLGEMTLELIQPTKGSSPYSEFLEATGGGIHHLGFSVEDLGKETTRLEQRGANLLWTGHGESRRLAELEMSANGLIVELVEST